MAICKNCGHDVKSHSNLQCNEIGYCCNCKDCKKKTKIAKLELDGMFEEFPSTKYDIGGLGHYIIVLSENKDKAIDDLVAQYRKDLEDNFEELEEEGWIK